MKAFLFRLLFIAVSLIISFFILLIVLQPIFTTSSLIIPYGINDFDICAKYPIAWKYMKIIYIIFYFFTVIILSNSFYSHFFKNISFKSKAQNIPASDNLYLHIGKKVSDCLDVFIPEKSLYQNILVTGTIGCGKTSCAMYPFSEQLIKYKSLLQDEKIGMLILDVKGNFHKQILNYCKKYYREDDVILINLGGKYNYNPLDKPNLKPHVLADRLKTILTLFSKNNSESYWLDKASQVLTECIKLCRLYNDGYVTFLEIHKLINFPNYYLEKVNYLKTCFKQAKFNQSQCFDLLSSLEFFETEFSNLDSRVLSIVKSEITRITSLFVSDYEITNTFCPPQNEINFYGFKDVITSRKNCNFPNGYCKLSKPCKSIGYIFKIRFSNRGSF